MGYVAHRAKLYPVSASRDSTGREGERYEDPKMGGTCQ